MLASAIRIYRITFMRCLPLALIGALLGAWVGSYARARASALESQIMGLMNAAVTAPDSALAAVDPAAAALSSLWRSPAVWTSYSGALLVGLGFHAALIARQSAWVDGRPDSGPQWLALTLRRVPSLLLAVLMLGLAAALALLLLIGSAAIGAAAALLVGSLLLILGSWVWGRLQLWLVTMFTQDLGALAALRASWELVRGHWWRVSSVITVPYVAIFGLSWLAEVLGAGASGALPGVAKAPLLAQLLGLASGVLALPVLPAVWLAIYQELRSNARAKSARA